ncbi:glutathione S-transferase family protein [Proteus mirabilis]|uniref:Glutathione S-transferase family protein n=1 Tax=Proteus mirabilis TaxID=584 RepID=A0ABD5LUR3_PROMI
MKFIKATALYFHLIRLKVISCGKNKLKSKFVYINDVLSKQKCVCGDHFTVADAYLFTLSQWAPHVALDLTDLSHLQDYLTRIAQRPNVHSALVTEGLIKE